MPNIMILGETSRIISDDFVMIEYENDVDSASAIRIVTKEQVTLTFDMAIGISPKQNYVLVIDDLVWRTYCQEEKMVNIGSHIQYQYTFVRANE